MITTYKDGSYSEVTLGDITLYFNYQTLKGFKSIDKVTVCESVFGSTTGKYIGRVCKDNTTWLPYDEFLKEVEKLEDSLMLGLTEEAK